MAEHTPKQPPLVAALRLERDVFSRVERLRQPTNEYAPPPPVARSLPLDCNL